MAINMPNYIELHVPISKLGVTAVMEALNLTTVAAGGVTKVHADGQWYDEAEKKWHNEGVLVYRWSFVNNSAISVDAAVRAAVQALHDSGELSVMRTRHYGIHAANFLRTSSGFLTRLIANLSDKE